MKALLLSFPVPLRLLGVPFRSSLSLLRNKGLILLLRPPGNYVKGMVDETGYLLT